ncbi:hypothetical protein [Nocardia sp. NPDC050793]|uniref:hypothetical protein n=1 Tax=Nocardia sp. NPDC050793 TaxID=3155159 RepID=UPI0033C0EC26
MERGNSKHGPKRDDELARELHGALHASPSNHADEWRDPEPSDEDVLTPRPKLPRPAPPDNPQP